jgi:UDP-GlcNAc:undecaprenyl-phosphate/decaprenyl-phosphate GlcNAc-1-phosphate transferase
MLHYYAFTAESLVAFAVAASLCGLVIARSRQAGHRLTRQGDLVAVQAAHLVPTPRLGGIAVFIALLAAAAVSAPGWNALWLHLILAVVPLFASGAAEDLGYRVAPVGRLGAALLSAVIAVVLTGTWITGTGLPGLDLLLAWAPLAVVITVIAASTIAHAFNLIDGLNGLAGLTALMAACGIAVTALWVGDTEILVMAVTLGGAVLGFLLFNFPFGRIFFGDAGAYSVGFLLAWLGISLAARHEDVTPLAMMLVLFWPLADLTLAIYRRRRRKLPVSLPDRLHFHQFAMRGLEIVGLGRARRRLTNPMATGLLLPFIGTPVAAGVLLHDRPVAAGLALLSFWALFFATYGLGMWLATRRAQISRGWRVAAAVARVPAVGGAN